MRQCRLGAPCSWRPHSPAPGSPAWNHFGGSREFRPRFRARSPSSFRSGWRLDGLRPPRRLSNGTYHLVDPKHRVPDPRHPCTRPFVSVKTVSSIEPSPRIPGSSMKRGVLVITGRVRSSEDVDVKTGADGRTQDRGDHRDQCRDRQADEYRCYYPGTEEAHTNPTRQRGECLRALAGASG